MNQVLKSTETTSEEFSLPGGVVIMQMEQHAGGVWQLECKALGSNTWLEDQMTFDADGRKAFYASHETPYRWTGGSVGAVAYALSNRDTGVKI